jgi:hypothetical protein
VQALKNELTQRGLNSKGNTAELVARLEQDRKKGSGCGWKGLVKDMAAHRVECAWVKCPNKDCAYSTLRTNLPEHEVTCGSRLVECVCEEKMPCRVLAEHEALCWLVKTNCPNEGCSVQYERGLMCHHRDECQYEEATCMCPGCDARLLRKDLDAHVKLKHLWSAEKQLQRLWRENTRLAALSESELRHAAASPTSWVFNWSADGWGTSKFYSSEYHTFGGGLEGSCLFTAFSRSEWYSIGFNFVSSEATCRVHATFSIAKSSKIGGGVAAVSCRRRRRRRSLCAQTGASDCARWCASA